jgi:hypothetical protein
MRKENTTYEDYERKNRIPGTGLTRAQFNDLPDPTPKEEEERRIRQQNRVQQMSGDWLSEPGTRQQFPTPNIQTVWKSPWTDQATPKYRK